MSGSVSARGLGFSSGSGSARVARLGLKFSRLTANVTDGRETARAARRWQCGVWGHKWGRLSNTKPNPMRPYGIGDHMMWSGGSSRGFKLKHIKSRSSDLSWSERGATGGLDWVEGTLDG